MTENAFSYPIKPTEVPRSGPEFVVVEPEVDPDGLTDSQIKDNLVVYMGDAMTYVRRGRDGMRELSGLSYHTNVGSPEWRDFDLTFNRFEQASRAERFREVIEDSKSIMVLSTPTSIGDVLFEIRYAMMLASAYPDKEVLFPTRHHNLFDTSVLPANVRIIPIDHGNYRYERTEETDEHSYLKEFEYAASDVLGKILSHINSDMAVFSPVFSGCSWQPVFARNTTRGSQDYVSRLVEFPDLIEYLPSIIINYGETTSAGSFWPRPDAVHMDKLQVALLRHILGIKADAIPHVPIVLPERDVDLSSDVLVIYDAKSEGRSKLLSANQWSEAIAGLIHTNSGLQISVIRGLTHPDDAQEIVKQTCDCLTTKYGLSVDEIDCQMKGLKILDLFDDKDGKSALVKLMERARSARVVVSTDTGPGQMVNSMIGRLRDSEQEDIPQLVGLFGMEGISPWVWRYVHGTTIIGKKTVDSLSPEVIYSAVQSKLSPESTSVSATNDLQSSGAIILGRLKAFFT